MFKPCCDHPHTVPYSIDHDPKPLNLPQDLTEAIERLLWYIPNIPSRQSRPHELIDNPIYSDFCFRYILYRIGMRREDILWVTEIDRDLIKPFQGQICVNCQKLILKRSTRTKTADLLRHIRNCIAHGYFNLCGDMLIGFDYDTNRKRYTAVIKIRPKTLLQALQLLDEEITKEHLFRYAFRELGYEVQMQPRELWGDMILTGKGKRYCVEIKMLEHSSPYIRDDAFRKLLQDFANAREVPRDAEPVLILDMGRLTRNAKKLLHRFPVRVMDIRAIEKLIQGIDVLEDG